MLCGCVGGCIVTSDEGWRRALRRPSPHCGGDVGVAGIPPMIDKLRRTSSVRTEDRPIFQYAALRRIGSLRLLLALRAGCSGLVLEHLSEALSGV